MRGHVIHVFDSAQEAEFIVEKPSAPIWLHETIPTSERHRALLCSHLGDKGSSLPFSPPFHPLRAAAGPRFRKGKEARRGGSLLGRLWPEEERPPHPGSGADRLPGR